MADNSTVAVGLVPGEFLPWVLRAPAGLVEVVVDSRILETLDQERVGARSRARGPLRGATETGLGYFVKWLDRPPSLGRPYPRIRQPFMDVALDGALIECFDSSPDLMEGVRPRAGRPRTVDLLRC